MAYFSSKRIYHDNFVHGFSFLENNYIENMQNQIQQKCIVIRSRKEKPYFKIQHRALKPKLDDVIVETVCFSVDPVMKVMLAGAKTYFNRVEVGQIFNCFGLGKIIRGNEYLETGAYIFGNIGTCNVNIIDEQRSREVFPVPTNLVKMYGEYEFCYLINNGLAAYAGYEIMKPKEGDTIVVSTASGATGLLLCQLLKHKKFKVIGLTSVHKIQTIKPYVDIVVDYKDGKQLQQILSTNKFQCYFDNVGEQLLDMALKYIQIGGRIALCGAIANYGNYANRGISNIGYVISKRLTLEGLTFMGMMPKIDQIFEEYKGVELKMIKIEMEQFEQFFTELLRSANSIMGKIIVKM